MQVLTKIKNPTITNIRLLPIQNLKSPVKMQTLNAGTSALIPKRTRLKSWKCLTLHSQFLLLITKNTQTEWPLRIPYFRIYTTLDETIRCASKWFILTLELVKLKCVTYAQPIRLFVYVRINFVCFAVAYTI